MNQLNYETLKEIQYQGFLQTKAPEKVLQFGEGNFLRAFVDYWFDLANEKSNFNGKCVILPPIPESAPVCNLLNKQEGLYTLYLRGTENGKSVNKKRIISSVSRCVNPYEKAGFDEMMKLAVSDDLQFVVSNTTEAGIYYNESEKLTDEPCASYPGKLTQILYARFQAGKKGLIILPCELNDNNGDMLRNCINQHIKDWQLPEAFRAYVETECLICNTLVDRIVPGRIRNEEEVKEIEKENGYQDALLDVGEVFGVWNIEGPSWLADVLPFKKAGLNVVVVPDVTPYKKRKVRILNGAHTGFVLGAYLSGKNIVRECMQDEVIKKYMNRMLKDEVIPTLPLDKTDCMQFASAVEDRFNNPFVDHALLSISLNSTSKWKVRNLPSLLEYVEKNQQLPQCLTMSFAFYLAFYSSQIQNLTDAGLQCIREDGTPYTISDDRFVLEFFYEHQKDSADELVKAVMENEKMWDMKLTSIPGFLEKTKKNLTLIRKEGAKAAFEKCLA